MLIRAVVALSALLLSGCASIVGKGVWPVLFTSDGGPMQFEVEDENGTFVGSGTTPTTIPLRASDGYFDPMTYRIRFAGRERFLEAEINIATVVNIFFPFIGVLGILVVDPLTGATFQLPEICRLIDPHREVLVDPAAAGGM